MHFKIPALTLALAVSIVATPISPLNEVNNACHHKRDIGTYVRRDASKTQGRRGKVKQQTHAKRIDKFVAFNAEKTATKATTNAEVTSLDHQDNKVAAVNAGNLGKRSHKVAAANTETLEQRSHKVAAFNAEKAVTNAEQAVTNAEVAFRRRRNDNRAAVNAGELRDLDGRSNEHAAINAGELTDLHERSLKHAAANTELLQQRSHKVAALNADVAAANAQIPRVVERAYYKIATTNAEVASLDARSKEAAENAGERTDLHSRSYKAVFAAAANAEVAAKNAQVARDNGAYKRKTISSPNNACYYKRDFTTGVVVAYKRESWNSEILCGDASA